jgi:HSP20 family protein
MVTYHWPAVFLNNFQDEMNKMLDRNLLSKGDVSNIATSEWSPTVDIKELPDHFQLQVDVPGIDPKDIHLNVDNNVLTIQGERKFEKAEKEENYHRTERSYGSFYRRFSFPDLVDLEKVKAKSKHGVLEITIPKMKKNQTQKIDIKIEE